ncbi:MAG: heme exporter protein CcmD [Pseudomonadales bacterium]|nr:heme exporter protein CcmD [Pseudomonadales bacterium]
MYFDNLADLWSMAGHGPYVWSAYAISFIVLLGTVVIPAKKYQKQLAQIRKQQSESV